MGQIRGKDTSGGGGIRTREPFRVVGFQDRCDRPLCHPSGGRGCIVQADVTHAKRTQYSPGSLSHRRGRPRQTAAALPVRQDQRSEIPQTPRRASTSSTSAWAIRPTCRTRSSSTKWCEAVRDERNHRYSVSNGLFNLRREAALRYERRHGVKLDPEHGSAGRPWLQGSLQPHVPGAAGPRRHGRRAGAVVSHPRLLRGPGVGQRASASTARSRTVFCPRSPTLPSIFTRGPRW